MKKRIQLVTAILAGSLFFLILAVTIFAQGGGRFEVSFPSFLRSEPITGRLIVVVSRKEEPEPRLTISPDGSPIFGMDVEQLPPDSTALIDGQATGYPVTSLKELPAGDYYVQAVMNVYTLCRRSDGHDVWIHLDESLGSPLNISPGNLYSDVQKIYLDPDTNWHVKLELNNIIPPVSYPADTGWLKHIKIQSQILTKFWGQPVYFGATILLPKDYDSHPDVRYPAVYVFEHRVPFSFSTDPKTQSRAARAKAAGLQTGYDFYRDWSSEEFPRFIAVTFHQPTPFFPSSYSVNSANCGPYGDALLQELIPYLENHFRIISKSYARLVEGASTGGWEALALQLYHPDYFGGAWIFNPDPIDFRRYQLVNIYEDENAFSIPMTEWRTADRPMRRTTQGQVLDTVRSMSRFEHVMGSRCRSGYQFNCWEAVYGPVGSDGYPVPLWDKLTGKINREVAAYMNDNGFDLRAYAERKWQEIGPKLIGKLNFFSGEMDNFYLNQAVYLFEDFLKSTKDPHYAGRFEYGRPMKGHNWHLDNWADMLREMAKYIKKRAPAGEDTGAWNY
jgi:hypothetical protein